MRDVGSVSSKLHVAEAAELTGERAATLLELLRPWDAHGPEVKRVAVELTLELAKLGLALDEARGRPA